MTAKLDPLTIAKEIASHMENSPMYATGLAHMSDNQFLRVALRAKRLLETRLSRGGQRVEHRDETLPELCSNVTCPRRKH